MIPNNPESARVTRAQLLHTFDAADTSREFRTEQAGVCSVAAGRLTAASPLINGASGQFQRFKLKTAPIRPWPPLYMLFVMGSRIFTMLL